MYGRLYNVISAATAATASQDLLTIVSASTAVTILRSLEISQTSEVSDAQEEQLEVQIITGYTSNGSGGSSVTPAPKSLGMSAFGGTARARDTTPASGGTPSTHRNVAFNVRGGYVWMPAEEDMIIIPPSARLVVRLPGTPADSITLVATATIEEIG